MPTGEPGGNPAIGRYAKPFTRDWSRIYHPRSPLRRWGSSRRSHTHLGSESLAALRVESPRGSGPLWASIGSGSGTAARV